MSAHQDSAAAIAAYVAWEPPCEVDVSKPARALGLIRAAFLAGWSAKPAPTDTTLREQRDELLEALEDILPRKLCGESWGLPDDEFVSITLTFGELKAARAAIAKARP